VLLASGIPEERAKFMSQGINNGHVVMGVNPRNDEDAEYLEQIGKQTRTRYLQIKLNFYMKCSYI
jgi:hypothetical protein